MRNQSKIQATNSLLAYTKQGAKPKQGQTIVQDTAYYIVEELNGAGGTQKLITPNTKRNLGVTNFEGNKLNAGKYFAIDGVKISAAFSEDINPYGSSTVYNVVDYAIDLLDAELVVKQGERILIKLPVFDLVDTRRTTSLKDNMDFREISTFPVLAPNEPFEINIEHKSDALYPNPNFNSLTTKVKVRIDFRGHEFKLV